MLGFWAQRFSVLRSRRPCMNSSQKLRQLDKITPIKDLLEGGLQKSLEGGYPRFSLLLNFKDESFSAEEFKTLLSQLRSQGYVPSLKMSQNYRRAVLSVTLPPKKTRFEEEETEKLKAELNVKISSCRSLRLRRVNHLVNLETVDVNVIDQVAYLLRDEGFHVKVEYVSNLKFAWMMVHLD